MAPEGTAEWRAVSLPELSRGVVCVWKIWLDGNLPSRADQQILSPQELRTAARFVFDGHRRRYIACRTALRRLLGHYLNSSPAEVGITTGEFGKPALSLFAGNPPVQFNVSHSDEWGLVAITVDDRVGVDLERLREVEDLDDLAASCFSDQELSELRSVRGEDRTTAFFNAWTRKEAFIKACGQGISFPLKAFDVTLRPGDPARLCSVQGSESGAGGWSLFDLAVQPGFAAAVAVQCPDAKVEVTGPALRPF